MGQFSLSLPVPRARVMRSSIAFVWFAAWAGMPAAAEAQENGARPVVDAVRMPDGAAIEIDGHLTDSVWDAARPIDELRQQDPVEGGIPSERSEIRIVYDTQALYIGAMLYDSDPSGILAHQLERDAPLMTDDRFMWILDTFRDGRTGYFFEINPAGLMGDGLIGGGGGRGFGVNKSWDGIWEVRTQILADGWSAEIRIPFSTLNFDPDLDAWGVDFQRTIRRRSEEILWSGWRRNESLFRPASAGELRGITDVSQGVGVEVRPFLLASSSQEVALGAPWESDASMGVDVNYSITPSLRASVTVNTDFAEVEVDQRRVNLTRFPLRFPEQRDFFLEGSGVFSFNWADPFFSRRIGLVQGQEVPIRYGARLGGQVGRYEIGAYQVRTGGARLTDSVDPFSGEPGLAWPSEDFTVGRVRRSLFEQSHVGVVYTRRSSSFDPHGEGLSDRHTLGGDFNFYTSQALGRYNAQFEGFLLYHTDPVEGGDLVSENRGAKGYRVNFPNDLIQFHYSYRDFGPEWSPAVGFAQRTGYRRYQPTLTVSPRPERWASIRQTEHGLWFEYLTDMDGLMLTREFDFTFLGIDFESGDRFAFEGLRQFERLERAFTIHGEGEDAIQVPVGDYRSWVWTVGFQTAGRRRISGGVDLQRSDFWGGERTQVDVSGTVRPARGISFSTDYQRNEVRLPQGDFDTNLIRLSSGWNLNPLTSLTASIQYDDVSRVVGLFTRARWIVRPGNEIYIVWNHNWRNEVARLLDRDFTTLSRGGAVKVNYSYRF